MKRFKPTVRGCPAYGFCGQFLGLMSAGVRWFRRNPRVRQYVTQYFLPPAAVVHSPLRRRVGRARAGSGDTIKRQARGASLSGATRRPAGVLTPLARRAAASSSRAVRSFDALEPATSVAVENGELVHRRPPRRRRAFPLRGDIPQGQPDQLRRRLVIWKMAAGFDDLTEPRVHALERVGRVDHATNLRRNAKKGTTRDEARRQAATTLGNRWPIPRAQRCRN